MAAIPLPGTASAFAVVTATVANNSSVGSLGFSMASYSASDAAALATNGTCGPDCGTVPLNWSAPEEIASFRSPVVAQIIASVGSLLVVAATAGGSTFLYNLSTTTGSWQAFGPQLSGSLVGLSGVPAELAVATVSGGAVTVTTVSASGSELGQATLTPVGWGSSGVLAASLILTPDGASYLESVVFSVAGSDLLEFSSSTNGVTFSTPQVIGSFSTATAGASYATAGETVSGGSGGQPGQVALAAVGSELFLLYTTNVSGTTVPATAASGTNGATWDGPYIDDPTNGSVLDPTLAVGPSGLVRAAWIVPEFGSGALEVATFESDGTPVLPPEVPPGVGVNGTAPVAAPAIAVDPFDRPLVLWAADPPNASSALEYTGAFLGVNASLNLTVAVAAASLGAWDLAQPADGASGVASLVSNVSLQVGQAEADLASGLLCAAQNVTGTTFYQNLTHVPLVAQPGETRGCTPTLSPNLQRSPLQGASGVDEPNTYLAVYADWALEAEGVPVSTSPLLALTQVAPYSSLALFASLSPPVSASETVNATAESVTVTPSPYSPTASELAVSETLQGWGSYVSIKCVRSNGGWTSGPIGSVTTVASTSTSVSVDGGPVHYFPPGTTSWTSFWVYDLPADQSVAWSATFSANTTTTTRSFNSNCDPTSTTRAGPSIGPLTVGGSFATTLSMAFNPPWVTATFNGTDSGATLAVKFNNTLPATSQGTLTQLTGGSGTQQWSS